MLRDRVRDIDKQYERASARSYCHLAPAVAGKAAQCSG
jgi:hypothetical protein